MITNSQVSGVVFLAVVLLLTSCEMVGSGETTVPWGADGKVTVASHLAYPPFEFSRGGEPRGFDIELMNEIADRAGFQVEYRNVPFDSIMQGLTTGLFDAAISAMTITGVREQQVDFSDPYYSVDKALVVRSGSEVESTSDLARETDGGRLGTTGHTEVGELMDPGDVRDIRTFETREEAFAALRDGSLDGVIHALPSSQDEVGESGGTLKLVEVIPTGKHYGIAFPKDSALIKPVNEALSEIKEDGAYEEIYERWISRPPEEIP